MAELVRCSLVHALYPIATSAALPMIQSPFLNYKTLTSACCHCEKKEKERKMDVACQYGMCNWGSEVVC